MNRPGPLRIGEPILFDGVGVLARGDVLLVAYAADASLQRTRWLHGIAEEFASKCVTSFLLFLVVPSGSKPPDPVTRAEDSAGYARLLPKVRRFVVVPEGTGFRASLVRLVINAYVTLTGKHSLVIATNVEQGLGRLSDHRTALTPSVEQLASDLEALRAELAASYPQERLSLRSASLRILGK